MDDLAKGLNAKSQIDLVRFDLSKAFNKVPHHRLFHKIQQYGVNGSTLSCIKDFLHDRTQTVILDGQESQEAAVTSGVPQGSILGHLLFLIYINDLPEYAKLSTTRLFADDCVLYRPISEPNHAELLQEDLDALQDWKHNWLMECEHLCITNKRKPIPSTYNICGHQLEQVEAQVPWCSHS